MLSSNSHDWGKLRWKYTKQEIEEIRYQLKLQDVSCWRGVVVSWFVWKYCIVLWKCYVSVSQYPIVGTAAAREDSSTSFPHQSRTPLIKGLGFNCHHFIIVLWPGMNNSPLIGQPTSDSSLIGQFNFTTWLFK